MSEFDFDTYVLENGFSYDGESGLYFCDEEDRELLMSKASMIYFSGDGVVSVTYSFLDKQKFLRFKKSLPRENFVKMRETENGKSYDYLIGYYDVHLDHMTVKISEYRSVSTYSIQILVKESDLELIIEEASE